MAAFVLKSKSQPVDTLAVCLCWGVGAMIGITATAKISGGHINPAVTTAQAVLKNFSWRKVAHYLAGQYLGGFVASAVVYCLYYDALLAFDGGVRSAYGGPDSTGHIWATYPAPFLSIAGAFADQVIGTAILLFAVLAITDENGLNVPMNVQPLYLCLTITVMCMAFGYNCMATLNPARDLAPRIFTTVAGWGWNSFQPLGGHFWWVGGVVGPHVGGVLGGWLYKCTVFNNRDNRVEPVDSNVASKDELQVISTAPKDTKNP